MDVPARYSPDDSELLAATSDTKDYTYESDTIRFEVSIQSATASIEMKRA